MFVDKRPLVAALSALLLTDGSSESRLRTFAALYEVSIEYDPGREQRVLMTNLENRLVF